MNVKPGWETTEFWTHIIGGVVGILAMAGVITPDQASQVVQAVTSIMGGLVVIASIFSYVQSRTQIKNTAAVAQAKVQQAAAYAPPTLATPPQAVPASPFPSMPVNTAPAAFSVNATAQYAQRDPTNSLPDGPPAPQYGQPGARPAIQAPTTIGLVDPAKANTMPSV